MESLSNSILRGGPSMILPGRFNGSLFVSTSSRKKLEAEVDGYFNYGYVDSGNRYGIDFELSYKPISNLTLSIEPEYSYRQAELQYVDQQQVGSDDRYIFGSIDQKTLSMSLRVD